MAQQEAVTVDGKRVILYKDGTWRYALTLAEIKPVKIDSLEMPWCSDGEIVCHAGYILSYNEET